MLLVVLLAFFTGCSGYHFKNIQGPLAKYGIKTIKIPMFLNKSAIPGLSGPLTRQFNVLMGSFPDLEVQLFGTTDAIMLGVIESSLEMRKALLTTRERIIINDPTSNPWRNFTSIGDRRKFWIPDMINMKLQLRIVLIKDPTNQEIEIIKSEYGRYIYDHPKVIFNKVISLEKGYTSEVFDILGVDPRGSLNFTQSMGNRESAIILLAEEAAYSFRESILYAF